jgi:hypothetical protein
MSASTTTASTTTATVKSSRLGLSFGSVSAGEFITFLDPLTSINLALAGDGNGNWRAIISCPYPGTQSYPNVPVGPGETLQIGTINGVSYSIAFSNEPGERLFSAIRATITGIESQ